MRGRLQPLPTKFLRLIFSDSQIMIMAHMRKNKLQVIRKSSGAQEFQESLLDEIRFDFKMNSLWIKYRFDIILPDNDYGKVIFNGNESDFEYEKLKDFISAFEENWIIKRNSQLPGDY